MVELTNVGCKLYVWDGGRLCLLWFVLGKVWCIVLVVMVCGCDGGFVILLLWL